MSLLLNILRLVFWIAVTGLIIWGMLVTLGPKIGTPTGALAVLIAICSVLGMAVWRRRRNQG